MNPWEEFQQAEGPWSEFEGADKAPSDLADQIPGMEPGKKTISGTRPQPKRDPYDVLGQTAIGALETGLSFVSQIPAGFLAAPVELAKGPRAAEEFMRDYSYQPRTEVGQEMTGASGEFFNRYITPLTGLPMPVAAMRQPVKGRSSEIPSTKLEKLSQQVEPHPADAFVQGEMFPDEAGPGMNLTPQQIAELQAREVGQRDLFAPANEPILARTPEADTSPLNPVRPMETVRQGELFDQSTGGRMATPYEAATGDWRIDENGIPVKVDLSMEAQNLQNPLQRNLWGDELEPTMSPVGQGLQGVNDMSTQMGTPLTQAIDSMPWAQRRGAINRELRGDLDATGELQGAVAEANSPFRVPEGQRGAINVKSLEDGFERIKTLVDGTRLWAFAEGDGQLNVIATNPEGTFIGGTRMSPENYRNPKPEDFMSSLSTTSFQRGLASEMYKFVSEMGNDIIPSKTRTPAGVHMWDKFEKTGLSKNMIIPRSQRGAIDLGNATEPKPNDRIANLTPDSPEVVAARAAFEADKKRSIAAGIAGLKGYRSNIDTPEKVIAAAPDAKDLTPAQLAMGKTVTPGANAMAINTGNPLVMFVRDKMRQVFWQSENLVHQYITGKDGISKTLQKLSQDERNEVVAALMMGDKNRKFLTQEELTAAGFTENQKQFIKQFYEMDAKKLEIWNEGRAKVGLEPVKALPGHVPGMFKGDYKQIVFGKNKDGSKKVIGVISVDTMSQVKKAQAKIKEQYPDAAFSTIDRRSLGGNGTKSDMFSGMGDVLNLLARNDPEFAKVKEIIDGAIVENADALYGASFHSMSKKGVFGSEGQKMWRDRNQNTNEFLKAYLSYWEEGIIAHLNLPVEKQIKSLLDNPALDNMPRAKQYVNMYVNNATGRNLGTIGDALNKLLDAPFRYTGLGSSVPRETVNQLNKRVSQHLMGWGNYVFSLIQYMQVPQMAMPEVQKIAGLAGINPAKAQVSFANVLRLAPGLIKEALVGDSNLPAFWKEAVQEAQNRGLMRFSEFQEVNKATQSQLSRTYDKVVDFNRSIAEQSTRPQVFFTMVDVLKDSGLPTKEIFDVAYNATQRSMIDYHTSERPMMYQRLGVVGQLAGSLTTFKHGQLSQLAGFIKDAGKGNPVPLLMALVVLNQFAGIQGTPFYQEADEMVKFITDKFFGGMKTIAELTMQNLPQWAKSGTLSTATDVNLQSRLSAANIIPDTPIEALSPYIGPVKDVVEAGMDLIKNPDKLAAANLAVAMAPSGPIKGLVETSVRTAPDGTPIDKKGMLGNPRSEWDTNVRKYSGATTLQEALRNEKQYTQILRDMTNKQAQTKIIEKAKRRYLTGNMTEEETKKLLADYVKRKGDPTQFAQTLVQYAQTTKLNKQQRLQGVPSNSLSSLYRYQNFNE